MQIKSWLFAILSSQPVQHTACSAISTEVFQQRVVAKTPGMSLGMDRMKVSPLDLPVRLYSSFCGGLNRQGRILE